MLAVTLGQSSLGLHMTARMPYPLAEACMTENPGASACVHLVRDGNAEHTRLRPDSGQKAKRMFFCIGRLITSYANGSPAEERKSSNSETGDRTPAPCGGVIAAKPQ